MIIGCPKETLTGEKRVAMTPESAKHLQKLGYDCIIQAGAGAEAGFADVAYDEAGVTVVKTPAALFKQADIVVKIRGVSDKEQSLLRADQTVISMILNQLE